METKSKFKKLLAQTNALTETEAGKLRGGITTLSTRREKLDGFNLVCFINIRRCNVQPQNPQK